MAVTIFTSIIDIAASLLRIYSNATDAQKKVIEWRLSDEARQYYSREENKTFYKKLLKGDTEICDAIRIEKQRKIEEALNKMNIKKIAIPCILMCFLLSGCGLLNIGIREVPKNINDNAVNVQSLKTTDKTYQVVDTQNIKVDDGKKQTISFDENWYLVHRDWLKKFNENQDALINLIDSKKTSTNSVVKTNSTTP